MKPDTILQAVLGGLGLQSTTNNLTSLFASHLSSKAIIIEPNTPNFPFQIQQRWTDINTPSYPIGGIKPATSKDVQKIVKIASENSIPFFVTGGGHGISDYSNFQGLAIDLGNFKDVALSKDQSSLTIGGSVKIYQLGELLYDAGKELPLGACQCVGVVGATLGGGIGGLQGIHGPLLDKLESVRIVTPDAQLLEASREENSELFWALRGAGSNFGIVTEATYKLPEATNNGMYMNADFVFPAAANESFFDLIKAFEDGMDERLAINVVVAYNRQINAPMIAVNTIFYGPLQDGLSIIKPFEALQPAMSNITMVPSYDIIDAAFFRSFGQDNGACTPNQHINIYSVALKDIHTPTFKNFFNEIVEFWIANPEFQGRWLLQRYANNAPLSIPDKDSAWGHRHTKMFMNLEGFYSDVSLDSAVHEFWGKARSSFAATSGYGQLRTYPNYARGDEGAEAWYGVENLPRLRAAKEKFDPKGLFSVNNPVMASEQSEQFDRWL